MKSHLSFIRDIDFIMTFQWSFLSFITAEVTLFCGQHWSINFVISPILFIFSGLCLLSYFITRPGIASKRFWKCRKCKTFFEYKKEEL